MLFRSMIIEHENTNDMEYIANLINENISESRINDLKLPYTKSELLDKILNASALQSEIIELPNDDTIKTETNDISKIDFSDLLESHGVMPTKRNSLQPHQEKLDNFGQTSQREVISVYGGSIKHKKKYISKTKRNKQKKLRKTIKKRRVRIKKHTKRR